MSPEVVGVVGIFIMLALMATGIWIGLAMGLVGFLGIVYIRGIEQALMMAGSIPYQNVAFYAISVVPMFVFMGLIISETGMGTDLYHTAHRWIGQVRGGLASATVIACALIAAITGNTYTGIIVMSKVAMPEMKKYGYDEALATGSICSAATMGILIPPSIAFVMYGILTEQPIGKLFIAGVIPGVLQAVFYVITIYTKCRLNPRLGPAGPKTSLKEKIVSLKGIWATLVLFLSVIGGIYGGIFTPTEAGAVGVLGSAVIAAVMRRFTWKTFYRSLRETVIMTGMILLILIGTFMFMHFMAVSRLPFAVGEWVVGLGVSKTVIIGGIIALYVVLGGPLPELPLVMLTIPIFYPVIQRLGIDPIWFGVIIVRMLEIGSISPPVGNNIFLMSGLSNVPIGTVYRGVMPFICADVLHVALLLAVPSLALFLPNMMR
jgi:tripartite ATP-independent transporter DctM subunit